MLFRSDAVLSAGQVLVDQGWLYLEAPESWAQCLSQATPDQAEALAGWRLHREGQAGAVHFHLFQRMATATG